MKEVTLCQRGHIKTSNSEGKNINKHLFIHNFMIVLIIFFWVLWTKRYYVWLIIKQKLWEQSWNDEKNTQLRIFFIALCNFVHYGDLIENQVLIEVHSQRSIDNMNYRYHFLTKTLETYQLLKKLTAVIFVILKKLRRFSMNVV